MKIIKSTDNNMRDDFAFLVQTEEGDSAIATTDGSVTRYKRFPVGTYLIEMFANRTGSSRFYYPCPESFVKKIVGMDADRAYDAMNRYVFA
jgi:hypothetical protein